MEDSEIRFLLEEDPQSACHALCYRVSFCSFTGQAAPSTLSGDVSRLLDRLSVRPLRDNVLTRLFTDITFSRDLSGNLRDMLSGVYKALCDNEETGDISDVLERVKPVKRAVLAWLSHCRRMDFFECLRVLYAHSGLREAVLKWVGDDDWRRLALAVVGGCTKEGGNETVLGGVQLWGALVCDMRSGSGGLSCTEVMLASKLETFGDDHLDCVLSGEKYCFTESVRRANVVSNRIFEKLVSSHGNGADDGHFSADPGPVSLCAIDALNSSMLMKALCACRGNSHVSDAESKYVKVAVKYFMTGHHPPGDVRPGMRSACRNRRPFSLLSFPLFIVHSAPASTEYGAGSARKAILPEHNSALLGALGRLYDSNLKFMHADALLCRDTALRFMCPNTLVSWIDVSARDASADKAELISSLVSGIGFAGECVSVLGGVPSDKEVEAILRDLGLPVSLFECKPSATNTRKLEAELNRIRHDVYVHAEDAGVSMCVDLVRLCIFLLRCRKRSGETLPPRGRSSLCRGVSALCAVYLDGNKDQCDAVSALLPLTVCDREAELVIPFRRAEGDRCQGACKSVLNRIQRISDLFLTSLLSTESVPLSTTTKFVRAVSANACYVFAGFFDAVSVVSCATVQKDLSRQIYHARKCILMYQVLVRERDMLTVPSDSGDACVNTVSESARRMARALYGRSIMTSFVLCVMSVRWVIADVMKARATTMQCLIRCLSGMKFDTDACGFDDVICVDGDDTLTCTGCLQKSRKTLSNPRFMSIVGCDGLVETIASCLPSNEDRLRAVQAIYFSNPTFPVNMLIPLLFKFSEGVSISKFNQLAVSVASDVNGIHNTNIVRGVKQMSKIAQKLYKARENGAEMACQDSELASLL
jgi:hypothetical protein